MSQPPKQGERDESTPRREDGILGSVKLGELPPLPRVNKSCVISSSHRYQGSLSSLKLRVRLLEYPPLEKNNKDEQHLGVIQDRVFSWQEKVDFVDDKEEGPRLYSYVDTDPFTAQQAKKSATIPRRKEVPTSKTANTATSLTTEEELEGWEDVGEIGDQVSTSGGQEVKTSQDSTTAAARDDDNVKKSTKTELKEQQLLLKTVKKRQEVEQRQALVDDLLRSEIATEEGLLGTHLRSKRPISSMSMSFLPGGRKDGSKRRPSRDDEGLKKISASSKGPLLPTYQRRTRAVEERSRRQRRQMLLLPSQTMIIMVNIPECSRRIVVCRIKALPTAGVVNIKAPPGFRVIHASRTHVYRLSWELHFPAASSSSKRSPSGERINKNQNKYPALGRMTTFDASSGVSFESVEHNELRVFLMGEILTARGFESEPLCVHFLLEAPQGWTNTNPGDGCGTTHSSYTTLDGHAHFSHHFSAQLSFSMDAIHHPHQTAKSPVLLIMVLSLKESGRVRYEGYGYASIPSTPGPHTLRILTWKPCHRSVVDKMQDLFLDATPSLQDMKSVHIPNDQSSKVGNRLGLATTPSGEVMIRLHLSHHAPSSIRDQASKLELLEKMSSATILKSVQRVIDAFNRARNKTQQLKNNSHNYQSTNLVH